MRRYVAVFVMCAAITGPQSANAVPTASEPVIQKPTLKEKIIALIDQFESAPISEKKLGLGSAIVLFAEKSEDVTVEIGSASGVTWADDGLPKEKGALLLAAYCAGSVRSQLLSGINKNDVEAGVEMSVKIYRQLQQDDPKFHSKSMDKLIEEKSAGRLKEYLKSLEKH